MKRILTLLLALILVFSMVSACKKDNKEEEELPDETTAAEETTAEEIVDDGLDYSDGMITEAYVPLLGLYFFDDYAVGDDLSDKDLVHLAAQFIYSQRQDLTATAPNDDTTFAVRESDIKTTITALFGGSIDTSNLSSFVNAELGESYEETHKIYYFSTDVFSYSPYGYSVSYDSIEFLEKGRDITATATLIDPDGNSIEIKYSLEKTVFNGYMFAKLTKAEKAAK